MHSLVSSKNVVQPLFLVMIIVYHKENLSKDFILQSMEYSECFN